MVTSMWDNTILPLFNQEAGEFIQTVKFPDQICKKGLVFREMSDCHHNPPCSIAQRAINHPEEESREIYKCKFCGSDTLIDPVDQIPPKNYCHESDHGM